LIIPEVILDNLLIKRKKMIFVAFTLYKILKKKLGKFLNNLLYRY